jgi:hypothetical protein
MSLGPGLVLGANVGAPSIVSSISELSSSLVGASLGTLDGISLGLSLILLLGAGLADGPSVGTSPAPSTESEGANDGKLLGKDDRISLGLSLSLLLGTGLADGPRVSVSDMGGIITSLSASTTVGVSESASDSVVGIPLGKRLGADDALGPIVGESTVSETGCASESPVDRAVVAAPVVEMVVGGAAVVSVVVPVE